MTLPPIRLTRGKQLRASFRARLAFHIFASLCFAIMLTARLGAQDAQGPLTPPPPEGHDVRRLGTEPEPPAPPSLPPEEIIKRFSQKEDAFAAARQNYGYRKTIRIDEFGEDGKQIGQYLLITDTIRAANGQVVNKVIQKPQSTLHYFNIEKIGRASCRERVDIMRQVG